MSRSKLNVSYHKNNIFNCAVDFTRTLNSMSIIRLTVSIVTKPQFENISELAAQRDSLPHVVSSKAVSFRCKVNASESENIQSVEKQALQVYENVAQVKATSLGIYDDSFSYLQPEESVKFSAEPKNSLYLIIDKISRNLAKRKESDIANGTSAGAKTKSALQQPDTKRRKPTTPSSNQFSKKVAASPTSQSTPSKSAVKRSAITRNVHSGSREGSPEPFDLGSTLPAGSITNKANDITQTAPPYGNTKEAASAIANAAQVVNNTTLHDMTNLQSEAAPQPPASQPTTQAVKSSADRTASRNKAKPTPVISEEPDVASKPAIESDGAKNAADPAETATQASTKATPKKEPVKRRTRKAAAAKEEQVAAEAAPETSKPANNGSKTVAVEASPEKIPTKKTPARKAATKKKEVLAKDSPDHVSNQNNGLSSVDLPNTVPEPATNTDSSKSTNITDNAIQPGTTKAKRNAASKATKSQAAKATGVTNTAALATASETASANASANAPNTAPNTAPETAAVAAANTAAVAAATHNVPRDPPVAFSQNDEDESTTSGESEAYGDSESEDEEEKSRRRQRVQRASIVSASRRSSSLSPAQATQPSPDVQPVQRASRARKVPQQATVLTTQPGSQEQADNKNHNNENENIVDIGDHVPGLGGFESLSKYQADVHDSKRPPAPPVAKDNDFQSSDEESEDSSGNSSEESDSESDDDASTTRRAPRKKTLKHLYS